MNKNRGEWSELYAFLKILADGKLYAADENVQRNPDLFFDVIEAIRHETNGDWRYKRNGKIKVLKAGNEEVLLEMPIDVFQNQADILFSEIISVRDKKRTFPVPESWKFAQSIKCNSVSAVSVDKADIFLVIHDARDGFEPKLGFSIKSELGAPPTLVNASGQTNFEYEIENLDSDLIDTINAIDSNRKIKDRLDAIYENNGYLKFKDLCKKEFRANLRLIDSNMALILSSFLVNFFIGNANSVPELTEYVIEDNPCFIEDEEKSNFYKYKIKEFLIAFAVGMVPGTVWEGDYYASGGCIVVKEDGDVLCYHVYNRNEFRDYLFNNTKLETPSSGKHGFGKIYEFNNKKHIKLNLQIRFLK